MILNSELLKGKIQMTSECLQSFQHFQLHWGIQMKTTLKLCLIQVRIAIIRNQEFGEIDPYFYFLGV